MTSVFSLSLSLQDIMDLKSVLSRIPSHQVLITSSKPSELIDYCQSVYLTQSLCCLPRLWASGLGCGRLCPGSALSASYSGACVQTEAEHPFEQTYVLLMSTNKRTNTHFHDSDKNLIRVPHGALSAAHFLSESWINCVSHSRKHIHTLSVVFGSVSIHSQWPISHFLSPRCTGAGEDGQVSFPTDCRAAVRIRHLLFRIIIMYTWGILLWRGPPYFPYFFYTIGNSSQ